MQLETFLEQSARLRPEKVALVCDAQRMTYAELEATANRLSHGLIAQGVRRGDRVAIHIENSIEAVVSIFAVLKAGAVFLVVNPTTKTDKLAYILNNCRATALIATQSRLARHGGLWEQTPLLKSAVVVGGSDAADRDAFPEETGTAFVGFERLVADHVWDTDPPEPRAIDVDLAALVYTSGSTGRPKGVMLTHRNMVAAATSITTYLENEPDDVILSVLPLAFDYGLYQALMSVKMGATLVLERSFTYPHAVLQRVVRRRVTGFPLVPTMLAMLLQMDLSDYDLSHLRYVSNTGAAMPTDHIRRLRQLLPDVAVYSMYGLTECKRVSYLPPALIDERTGSVGKAMPNSETFIVDDDGRRLGPGQIGELVVRGSNVMAGYWELPEETDKMLKPGPLPGERVLHTGDLFRTDDDGFLYFVGRKDDIIKSRGEKVSPKEVENVLCKHPSIAEAAVVGISDEVLGQSIHAIVAPRKGHSLTDRDVLRHCANHLEDFMVPHAVRLCDSLPKTGNGKVDKKSLKQEILGATT